MKNKKEIAKLIYEELKKGNIKSIISLISKELEKEKTDKLQFTKTSILNSIGQELGKLFIKEGCKFERLLDLWKALKMDRDIGYGLKEGREIRRIIIVAFGELSKKCYKEVKNALLLITKDINDWETVDTLALFVVSRLAVQNQKEIFSLMEEWIKSDNKWIRRLAIATIPSYIRAKPEESKICLEFLDNVMKEEDKDVKKAIGWALREITKKDSKSFEFLLRWAKVDDRNTKWIIKEGMKKLPKDEQKTLKSLIERQNEN